VVGCVQRSEAIDLTARTELIEALELAAEFFDRGTHRALDVTSKLRHINSTVCYAGR
jgi:hypothetical protein